MSDFEIAKINKLIDIMENAFAQEDKEVSLHNAARVIAEDWNPRTIVEANPRTLQDAFVVRD